MPLSVVAAGDGEGLPVPVPEKLRHLMEKAPGLRIGDLIPNPGASSISRRCFGPARGGVNSLGPLHVLRSLHALHVPALQKPSLQRDSAGIAAMQPAPRITASRSPDPAPPPPSSGHAPRPTNPTHRCPVASRSASARRAAMS